MSSLLNPGKARRYMGSFQNGLRGVPLVVVFALIGFVGLHVSHAATYVANHEAEAGTLTGNYGPGDPAGASAGASIKFGTTTSPGGGLQLNGLSTDPNFFPITVWLQTPGANAQNYKDIGVNTFFGLYDGISESALTSLKNAGQVLIAEQNQTGLTSANKSIIKAWTQEDEPDNAQANGSGGYDPCISPSTIVNKYTAIKAADSTRPVMINFGRGVADTGWVGRGTCTGNTAMYTQYAQGADLLSYDVYPRNEGLALNYVAKGVDNLRSWTNDTKPVYAFIETTNYDGTAGPSPADIKAEVWLALTHGAVGISYFCHIFSPSFIEAGCLSVTANANAMKTINLQITSLAPVLNSPTLTNATTTVTGSAKLDTIVKALGGATYVFAVESKGAATTATIKPAGLTGGTVTVIDENRTMPLSGGAFSDSFSAYGVHLYKITP